MPKLILRAALAGCAAAGLAAAQTPAPPPIAVAPPVPTQPVAPPVAVYTFRAIPLTPAKTVLKTFDVADLVCPPADSPLAKPGTDPAMVAAAKAFAEVRGEGLMKGLRAVGVRGTWEADGGAGKMALTTDGTTLVVSGGEIEVDMVGECVKRLRKLHTAQVKVDLVLFTVSSNTEAVAKLFGEKATAAVNADEFNVVLRELKASGAADVLSRPTLVLTNKQTGFCQVEQQAAVITHTTRGPDGTPTQYLAYQPVGTTARVTPDVSADLKSVLLAVDIRHSDCTGGKVDCQQTQTKLVVPNGGTMLVKVGTRVVERKTENKVPVVGDIPYMSRLFRNVSISSEPTDVVAVVTVTRVSDAPCAPPLAVATPPMMPTAMPYSTPLAAPVPVMPSPIIRTTGTDGLERVGVNFNTLTAPVALPPAAQWVRFTAPAGTSVIRFLPLEHQAVAGGVIGATVNGDDTAAVMAAYKAACAAGRTDEAARLGVQLLAKDPTCFGK